MMEEYHKLRTIKISGNEKEISTIIHNRLKEKALRYLKLELESEGTLYYEGKLTVRY